MTTQPTAMLIDIPTAAEICGLGTTTVKAIIRRGELHPVHVGRRTLLHARELESWGRRLAENAGVPAGAFASELDGPAGVG